MDNLTLNLIISQYSANITLIQAMDSSINSNLTRLRLRLLELMDINATQRSLWKLVSKMFTIFVPKFT